MEVRAVADDAAHGPVHFTQLVDGSAHLQMKVRVVPCVLRQEPEKAGLRHHHHVRERRRQPPELRHAVNAAGGDEPQLAHLHVRQCVQRLGEPNLIEDLQR